MDLLEIFLGQIPFKREENIIYFINGYRIFIIETFYKI